MSSNSDKKLSQDELISMALKSSSQSKDKLEQAAPVQQSVMLTERNWTSLIQTVDKLIETQKIYNEQIQTIATKQELEEYQQTYHRMYLTIYNEMIEHLKWANEQINKKISIANKEINDSSLDIEMKVNRGMSMIKYTVDSGKSDIGTTKDEVLSDIQSLKDKLKTMILRHITILLTPSLILMILMIVDIFQRAKS